MPVPKPNGDWQKGKQNEGNHLSSTCSLLALEGLFELDMLVVQAVEQPTHLSLPRLERTTCSLDSIPCLPGCQVVKLAS